MRFLFACKNTLNTADYGTRVSFKLWMGLIMDLLFKRWWWHHHGSLHVVIILVYWNVRMHLNWFILAWYMYLRMWTRIWSSFSGMFPLHFLHHIRLVKNWFWNSSFAFVEKRELWFQSTLFSIKYERKGWQRLDFAIIKFLYLKFLCFSVYRLC